MKHPQTNNHNIIIQIRVNIIIIDTINKRKIMKSKVLIKVIIRE
jgi:hypothetical protein